MDFSSPSSSSSTPSFPTNPTNPRWELPIHETPPHLPPPPPSMEHMFDKVVTPSDVGKLNRLVIPKQHAEKHFPLDSNSSEKGLLLDFEDRSGKSWRFRYSYWNSSQSYVMTKGWSRFVKDKKLDAGDVVSFHRRVGKKDQFYIDWRRRPDAPPPPMMMMPPHHRGFQFQHGYHHRPFLVGPPPPPQPPLPSTVLSYNNNYYNNYPNLWRQQRPSSVVLESVPVGPRSVAGKRLRLFGVNMDCTVTERVPLSNSVGDSSSSELQLRLHGDGSGSSTQEIEFLDKGKSSMTLDFDI